MAVHHLFAGVAVAQLEAALAWYERFLGRPPDMRPNDTEAVWQLTDGGSVYVVADEERAGKSLVTIMVDDIDADLAGMEERGIVTGPVDTAPGLFRRTALTDPEGN